MARIASDLPWWAWPVAVILVLVILSMIVRAARAGFSVQTDPQRMFDGNQRTEGRRRCESRCEHKPMLWRRCDGAADHADHIYP